MGNAAAKGGDGRPKRRFSSPLGGCAGNGGSETEIIDGTVNPDEDMDFSKHDGADPTLDPGYDGHSELPIVNQADICELRYLGSGEFCSVYASELKGQKVAIKKLKPEQIKNATAQRDLLQEIALMGSMAHRNVLRPLAHGQYDESPMLVMPIISQMLSDSLPKPADAVPVWTRRAQVKQWPLSRALRCGMELAEALHYCHTAARAEHRILHRDIKPNNIGFLADGRLVVFDFGLAKLWRIDDESDSQGRRLTGQTGSLRYMAPEVALSQPYNHKAEVFSFATVLWQMCAHEVPFSAFEVESFMDKVCKKGERPRMKKEWSAELQQLFTDCWQPVHASRPDFADVLPVLRAQHKAAVERDPQRRPTTA